MVPKNVSQEQKDIRRERFLDLLESIENDQQLLEHVITGDESWVFEYDPRTKHQTMEWHTSGFPKPKHKWANLDLLLDNQRIIHKKYVPKVQTVNRHFYR